MTEAEFYGYAGMPFPDIVEIPIKSAKVLNCRTAVAEFLASKKAKHAARERSTAAAGDRMRGGDRAGLGGSGRARRLRDERPAGPRRPHQARGLGDLFPSDKIVCVADSKGRGKPLPDIFLRAAAVAGVDALAAPGARAAGGPAERVGPAAPW